MAFWDHPDAIWIALAPMKMPDIFMPCCSWWPYVWNAIGLRIPHSIASKFLANVIACWASGYVWDAMRVTTGHHGGAFKRMMG